MPRLTRIVLAGALCWPAANFVSQGLAAEPPYSTRPIDPTLPAVVPPAVEEPVKTEVVKTEGIGVEVPPLPAPPSTPVVPMMSPPRHAPTAALPPMAPTTPAPVAVMPPRPVPMAVGMQPAPAPAAYPAPAPVNYMPVAPMPAPADCAGAGTCNDPCCGESPSGLVAFGDYLMVKARRSDAAVFSVATLGLTSESSGSEYGANYESAFRAGVGYLHGSGWLFTATYFEYDQVVGSDSVVQVSPNFAFTYVGPGQLAGQSTLTGDILASNWAMSWQTLDFMGGAASRPADCLEVITSAGVRLAQVDQTYTTLLGNQGEKLTLDMQGVGPRVGADARISLTNCLALTGRGYGSLLLSNREDRSTAVIVPVAGPVSTRNVHYNREEVLPWIELAVGVETTWLKNHLLIGGGYEFQYVWQLGTSTVENAGVPGPSNHNDISLDGWYVRAAFMW